LFLFANFARFLAGSIPKIFLNLRGIFLSIIIAILIVLGHNNFNFLFISFRVSFPIKIEWLQERNHKLWIHCKNHKALETLYGSEFHYFWHHDDDVTLTSRGIIWAHPKIQPLKNSIAVLPDNYDWDLNNCMGICSDYIKKYENIN